MKKWHHDYELWKDVGAMVSYIALIISFIGPNIMGSVYTFTMVTAIASVGICVFQMVKVKKREHIP